MSEYDAQPSLAPTGNDRFKSSPSNYADLPLEPSDSTTESTPAEVVADTILKERTQEYGNAHLVTGAVLSVTYPFEGRLRQSGFAHNWNMIMGKLIRILFSPMKVDHWIDIMNFAKLVADELLKQQSK